MGVLFDKDGKRYDIPHPVDVKEAMKTGKYFAADPTKRKIIKPARKNKIAKKEPIKDTPKEEASAEEEEVVEEEEVIEEEEEKVVEDSNKKDAVIPLFGGKVE